MAEPVFALIDCNSFYCSCERLWRPDLAHRPIVVLSNNDGCIISRSAEAKALGIPMGAPYFQVRRQLERQNVAVFSSNYALYGDMSQRVMAVIESLVPAVEVYSIDEAFADLSGLTGDLEVLGHQLRQTVLQRTGIPVGVGIATTKTLAKLANHAAKKWRRTGGVVDLRAPARRERLLDITPVGEVWGIGRRLSAQLQGLGIDSAGDLARAEPALLRQRFSVVVEKTARELRGLACLPLEDVTPPKQAICCSRMFGQRQYALPALAEAVSSYAVRAAEKLRTQGSLCRQVRVGIRTGLHNPDEAKYASGAQVSLPCPSDDTRLICRAALDGLQRIYRQGPAYSKAEVLLLDLCRRDQCSQDLFAPALDAGSERLMGVLDQVNARWGNGTLRPARLRAEPTWQMRRDLISPAYTTRFDQLWEVACR